MKISVYEFTKTDVHDLYTIVIDRQDKEFPKEMWGMNRAGGYYFCKDSRDQGFSVGKHLGKKVKLHNLPVDIQKSIIGNLLVVETE